MSRQTASNISQVARLVRRCLREGGSVEIDGLGVFRPNGDGRFEFVAEMRPQVFLAHAAEDATLVERLYDDLHRNGFEPWMDRRKLMPGQNWPRAIERAIDTSSYFFACLSNRSVTKIGHFHAEMRYALTCARKVPIDEIFFIPLRFDECHVPNEISRDLQYVDMFPDWHKGIERILTVMRIQERARRDRHSPAA
jgi:hypothetical protein